MENNELKEFGEIITDFKKFCKHFLKIKNKSGQIVPLVPNPPQLKLLDIILDRISKKLSIRIIILKARQVGISTIIEAFLFWWNYINDNQKSAVIGHDADASTNLFDIYKRYHEYLPSSVQHEIKKSNAKEVIFENHNSEMRVFTAEGREGVGRSSTLQALHTTEVGFYADAESVMTALLQSLSDDGMFFEESTANGLGGKFYEDWKDAVAGKNGMIPVFIAWFDLPEYSKAFESEDVKFEFLATLDATEKILLDVTKLTLEQLNWRRETIKFKCSGNVDIFKQEYPSNDKEAFLTTGRPIFDSKICDANYTIYENFKPERFDLVATEIDDRNNIIKVKRVNNPYGYFSLLEPFTVDDGEQMRFASGWDIAEGLEQGDYSSGDVLDRKTMHYVIKFHGHIDPDLLAVEQFKLQLFLKGKVYFCTERNNQGLTTITTAFKLHLNQYYQENFQKGYEVPTQMLGFKTTSLTKPLIINTLGEAIREQEFTDKDKNFWDEALTFVRDSKGGMSAQGKSKDPATKCYDDRVISKALSLQCHKWMPAYYPNPAETQRLPGQDLYTEDLQELNNYASYE